jgi:hypothetical protein
LHYEGYGKNYIKKFKASPDAWAQLVKQLAFHKMFNRPGVTYESAQTRKYQLGRTEVIRSASNESKEWAEAMLDPEQTVGGVSSARYPLANWYLFRMNIVPPSSAALLLVTFSTPHGPPTAKALIVIFSVSRKC